MRWCGTSKTKTFEQKQDCAQPPRPMAAFCSNVAPYSICCATGSISARSNTKVNSCPVSSQRSWIGKFFMQVSRSSPVNVAGARSPSRKATEEGEVHCTPPPHQHRLRADGVLRAQTRCRLRGGWTDVADLRSRP